MLQLLNKVGRCEVTYWVGEHSGEVGSVGIGALPGQAMIYL